MYSISKALKYFAVALTLNVVVGFCLFAAAYRSISPPINNGAPPYISISPPTNFVSPPVNNGAPPHISISPPINNCASPYISISSPTNFVFPPENNGSPPYRSISSSINNGAPPCNLGYPPENNGAPSYSVGYPPENNDMLPYSFKSPPLRVFMYDLSPRFNVGMMDPNFPVNVNVTAENIPPWEWNDDLRKQHSVEYYMMASLLYEGGDFDMEAVRVMDTHAADVFFLPFFSSLSFNTVPNMSVRDSVDERLQREMVQFLHTQKTWNTSGGRDHVIPLHHPNAFRHYRDEINDAIFIVADFGRIMNITKLAKDVVAPYNHMLETYEEYKDPYDSRHIFLFFRGRTNRKDDGKIRAQLNKVLERTEDIIFEEGNATGEGFKASTEQMRSSKFCLHPAGDTPSSCRLFDAIASHCVPVIVSDRIELPFESELNYREFSVFFSVKQAITPGYMISKLREISKRKWMKKWLKLKKVSHHFEFHYPPQKDDAVNMIWRQVRNKLPEVRLSVHRSWRLKIQDWWI